MIGQEKGMVRSVDIANQLGYSKPSVSVAVRNLCESGHITMDEDKYVHLTEAGKAVAEQIYDRHRTLEAILVSLGVDKAQAAKDACKVEHDLSQESYDAIKGMWQKMLDTFA